MPNVGENSTIEDKINFILYNEINPMLASHGGEVSLIEFTEDSDVILQFGGGCQGCGMIDIPAPRYALASLPLFFLKK